MGLIGLRRENSAAGIEPELAVLAVGSDIDAPLRRDIGAGVVIAFTQGANVRGDLDGLAPIFANALFRAPAKARSLASLIDGLHLIRGPRCA